MVAEPELGTHDISLKSSDLTNSIKSYPPEQYFATRSFSNFENLPPSLSMAPLSSRILIDAVDELVSPSSPTKKHTTLRDSRQMQHRCVTFAAEEEIHEIPYMRIEELSVDECQTLYYSKGDYGRIAKENNETLCLMKKRHFPGTENLYFRGLEGQLPIAKHESHQRILLAVEVVLREQRFGIIQPYWVNSVYSAFTVDATHVAHMMGVWDAEAVKAEEEEAAPLLDKS